MVTLFRYLSREEAGTYALVLESIGIGYRMSEADDGVRIEVPEATAESALDAIRRYRSENQVLPKNSTNRYRVPFPVSYSGIVVALVLLAIHVAIVTSAAPEDYHRVFGADAHRILSGEVYRCATALLVHADATHIAANMVGIALFGGAVCALTGTGVGWLMILICGVLGNLMNAWAYQTDHLSIGASTAIFGAVGILSAIQAVGAVRTGEGWKRVALIAGAGMSLLAFLGTGPRSDIGAHLFGCLAGVLVGTAHGLWVNPPLGNRGQVTCGVMATLALLLSWIDGARP